MTWHLIKNHKGGQPQPESVLAAEITAAVDEFEQETGEKLDEILLEELGLGEWVVTGEKPFNYSHPVIRIEAHGSFTLLAIAVPASLLNGVADFTNLLVLAHPRSLMMILRDPPKTFASAFGGLLLRDYNDHSAGRRHFDAGDALISAIRSCVTCFESSLTFLRGALKGHLDSLRNAEEQKQLRTHDHDKLEGNFGRLLAELRAIERSPSQLSVVCDTIERASSLGRSDSLFDHSAARYVAYCRARCVQFDAIIGSMIVEIERAIKRCDDLSTRELLLAQRMNTYWTSALLLPNLVFAFFGQSILGNVRDGSTFWIISGSALLIYGAGSLYFLVYRTRHLR